MWRAMEAKATQVAGMLAEAQETRRQWEALTEPTRRMTLAADLELRRRHPGPALEPLTPADTAGIANPDHAPTSAPRKEVWVQQTLDGAAHLAAEDAEKPKTPNVQPVLTRAQREARGQQLLGLTPDAVHEAIPEQVLRIRENVREAQETIDRIRTTPQFAEDDDAVYLGPAWDVLGQRERGAILQPPKPDVMPAREIARRVQDRWATQEAERG